MQPYLPIGINTKIYDCSAHERDIERTVHIYGDVAILSLFVDHMTRKSDIRNLFITLANYGVKTVLMNPIAGRNMPYGETISEGPFAGWLSLGIERFAEMRPFPELR